MALDFNHAQASEDAFAPMSVNLRSEADVLLKKSKDHQAPRKPVEATASDIKDDFSAYRKNLGNLPIEEQLLCLRYLVTYSTRSYYCGDPCDSRDPALFFASDAILSIAKETKQPSLPLYRALREIPAHYKILKNEAYDLLTNLFHHSKAQQDTDDCALGLCYFIVHGKKVNNLRYRKTKGPEMNTLIPPLRKPQGKLPVDNAMAKLLRVIPNINDQHLKRAVVVFAATHAHEGKDKDDLYKTAAILSTSLRAQDIPPSTDWPPSVMANLNKQQLKKNGGTQIRGLFVDDLDPWQQRTLTL